MYKPPKVYILNATGLVKPHGIESLRCDVFQLRPDIVIITESWLKSHHSDGLISIDGYSSFRRDRVKKRGGGVDCELQRKQELKNFLKLIYIKEIPI